MIVLLGGLVVSCCVCVRFEDAHRPLVFCRRGLSRGSHGTSSILIHYRQTANTNSFSLFPTQTTVLLLLALFAVAPITCSCLVSLLYSLYLFIAYEESGLHYAQEFEVGSTNAILKQSKNSSAIYSLVSLTYHNNVFLSNV